MIHRNSDWTEEERYNPDEAHRKYREHLSKKGAGLKIGKDKELADYVCDDLWQDMFLSNIFGRPLFEDAEIPAELDPAGEAIIPAHTERRRKLNPASQKSCRATQIACPDQMLY